jgi:hypothetical protein
MAAALAEISPGQPLRCAQVMILLIFTVSQGISWPHLRCYQGAPGSQSVLLSPSPVLKSCLPWLLALGHSKPNFEGWSVDFTSPRT